MFVIEERYTSLSFYSLLISMVVGLSFGALASDWRTGGVSVVALMFIFSFTGWLSFLYPVFAIVVMLGLAFMPQFLRT
jgi:hypothetical protein